MILKFTFVKGVLSAKDIMLLQHMYAVLLCIMYLQSFMIFVAVNLLMMKLVHHLA